MVCLQVIKELDKYKIEDRGHGFNKCWLFMQLLHDIQQDTNIGLPYYWFKDGVVVDPESLMLITHGKIKFKWEPDCKGCQIEKECPCEGSPNNNDYIFIKETLMSWRSFIEWKSKKFN